MTRLPYLYFLWLIEIFFIVWLNHFIFPFRIQEQFVNQRKAAMSQIWIWNLNFENWRHSWFMSQRLIQHTDIQLQQLDLMTRWLVYVSMYYFNIHFCPIFYICYIILHIYAEFMAMIRNNEWNKKLLKSNLDLNSFERFFIF